MRARGRLPSGATIVAWLGTIATLLGIVSFFILDLPNIIGGGDSDNLSSEHIIATMAALQQEKQDAQFQLTQIAVQNAQAANLATQQWLATQAAQYEAELANIHATQDTFASTQNAISAANSTNAAATATQDAVGTQSVLDVTATAAFIAQITPTPTDLPTATPQPTDTPVPPPVDDYHSINGADVRSNNEGMVEFAIEVAQPIPDPPPGDLAYVWLIDKDRNPATGLSVQDMGADVVISAEVENGAWVGTFRTVQEDGTLSDPLFISDISASGPRLSLVLNPAHFDLPTFFDWVVRAEANSVGYSLFPAEGHLTLGQ
jgi:hypothetical protein